MNGAYAIAASVLIVGCLAVTAYFFTHRQEEPTSYDRVRQLQTACIQSGGNWVGATEFGRCEHNS
jgi:hypothetical protein